MPRNAMDVFHDFFHSDRGSAPMSGNRNYWYHGKTLLSYSTVIAQKEVAGDGSNVVFVSIDNFTSTTAQHVASVRQSVPKDWTVLDYPFVKGDDHVHSPDDFRRGYEKALLEFTEKDMARLGTRDRFTRLVGSWRRFLELFGMEASPDVEAHAKELEPVAEKFEERRARAGETRRNTSGKTSDEKDRARRERIDRMMAKFGKYGVDRIGTGNLARLVEALPTTDGFREKVYRWHFTNGCRFLVPVHKVTPWYMRDDRPLSFREFLENPPQRMKDRQKLAFARVDGNLVVTSMGVKVSVNHVRAAFERFDSLEDRKNFEGYSVAGRYRVVHVCPEGIVIGCHVIPVENINELRKEVMKGE